jgi:FkbM family methyltransferase
MLVEKLFTKDSWSFLQWARARHGALPAIGFWSRREGQLARVPIDSDFQHQVWLRMGTTDVNVLDQVFGHGHDEREYEFDYGRPKFIIDAGAHIGLTSIFFALKYPEALVVAIEPDRENWLLAKRNTAPFPNITVLRGALWNREAHLAIANPDGSPWSYHCMEDLVGEHASDVDACLSLPGYTADSLRQYFKQERIDVLKMDIEGSEVEVLPSIDMRTVGVLACELHDHKKTGCRSALEKAAPGWKETVRGSTHILTAA